MCKGVYVLNQLSFIQTKSGHCKGCNKCIFVCPTSANESLFEEDEGKVFIKDGYCISCGECLSICDHNARDYFDDTHQFFDDLKRGEQISVVIAPAARFNLEDTMKAISYLKSMGVNKVYDVSFGADICTWAHVKLVKEYNIKTFIAQPCPVVVSYIEKYRPALINKLSPIQSPVACLSIFLKKYLGIKDKIAFLSPCIGKKRECNNLYTDESIHYNVTFDKFTEYLKRNNINLNMYKQTNFDNAHGSIGFAFPRPGGLSENIKYNLGEDVWIKQIEGIKNISDYLDEYIQDIKAGKPVPLIIDALNCIHGCNLGTGTNKKANQNEIDYLTNNTKATVTREHTHKLMNYFNSKLNLLDFGRHYKDRSFDYKKRADVDIEGAFITLGKVTAEDRQINCFCCGYGNCYDFAYDLATGHNDKNNCRHYLLNKFKKMSLHDDLTGLFNRNCFNLEAKKFFSEHPGFVAIIFADINGLKDANDIFGHAYGDTLITTCANICKKAFQKGVYRLGGDEFVILCSDCNEQQFYATYETLKDLFSLEKELKVSLGYAISTSAQDFSDKIEEADKNMYTAKQNFYSNMRREDRRNRRSSKFY